MLHNCLTTSTKSIKILLYFVYICNYFWLEDVYIILILLLLTTIVECSNNILAKEEHWVNTVEIFMYGIAETKNC